MPVMTVLLIGATVAVWWSVQGGGLSCAPLAESICRYGLIPVEVTGFARVGAEGPWAVSGVMGAYLVLYARARVDTLFFFFLFFRVVPLPAWLMLGYWMLLQVAASTLTPEGAGGVAYMAHIGGFAAGIVLLPFFRDRGKATTRRRRRDRGWW